MDICFYRYSLQNRGGDRMIIEYANHLAESGHAVTIITSRNETVFKVSPLIKQRFVPWPGKIGFLAYTISHRLPYDVVIVDIIHLTPLLHCSGTMVYFAQADDVEYYGYSLQRRFVGWLYNRFFSRKGLCITVFNHLTEMFHNRYSAHSCRTVVNGIDLKTFYPQPDVKLASAKCERKAVFFMARGDRYRKGYDLALKVFSQMDADVSGKMELWVCGNRLDAEYPFPVRQFGVVDDNRLRQLLSSADLFFYPSRHEGFGLFPLEAMACGAVVVTTDAVPYASRFPCIHTVEIGRVDQMLTVLKNLLSNPQQIAKDQQTGFEIAATFDLENSKEAFAQALVELIGESHAHRD